MQEESKRDSGLNEDIILKKKRAPGGDRLYATINHRVQLRGMIMDESEIQHAEQVGQDNINVLWSVFKRCTYEKGWKLEKTEISTDGYEIIL